MSKLSEYLAKNYLTASTQSNSGRDPSDTRPSKKRKKNKSSNNNNNTNHSSLLIADDDADLLLSSKQNVVDDEQDGAIPSYEGQMRTAEFRKSKKNAWLNVSRSVAPSTTNGNGDEDADILLRKMQEETAQERSKFDAENEPTVVVTTSDNGEKEEKGDGNEMRMESGAKAGIQTAQDTARLQAEQDAREQQLSSISKKKKKKKRHDLEDDGDVDGEVEEETVYRDATGRRIDLTLRRQEHQRAQHAKKMAEKKAKEDAMGAVQLQQRAERQQDLEDAKFLTLGRSADDEEMNERLKEEVRWDDPMAQYILSQKQKSDLEDTEHRSKSKDDRVHGLNVNKQKKREYAGAAPPNRYGIKPGWRWDGVDRGNGFESQWFQARGRKARNENLEYMWQMDE